MLCENYRILLPQFYRKNSVKLLFTEEPEQPYSKLISRKIRETEIHVFPFLHSLLIGDQVKNFHTLPPDLLVKCEGMKILYL